MAFAEAMNHMRESIQRSLDELASPRSTLRSKMLALQNLERNLAKASLSFSPDSHDESAKDAFFALQYTFECNIPSRLLPWIMMTTTLLETLTNKGHMHDGRDVEIDDIASQLALSLSLIQGVTLSHEASKIYMGRRPALEILLDLLLTSRHLGSTSSEDSGSAKGASNSGTAPQPLTSLVLDTLLCILVDSPTALRAFEEANGVQSIVKILKRAGTPREVRMKCLEFLYFYLLDETPDSSALLKMKATQPTPPPTAPATPIRTVLPKSKPYLNATPLRPTSSRYGSSTFSFSSSSSTTAMTTAAVVGTITTPTDGGRLSTSISSSTSSRSTSGSSMNSFCSTLSNASSSTAASSMPASPVKESFSTSATAISPPPGLLPKALLKSPVKRTLMPMTRRQATPPSSSPSSSSGSSSSANLGLNAKYPQIRSMMMLRKEVDYVPQSPKKMPASPVPVPSQIQAQKQTQTQSPVSGHGSGLAARPGHRKSLSTSTLGQVRSRSQATLVSSTCDDNGVRGMERGLGKGKEASLPNLGFPSRSRSQEIELDVDLARSGEDTDTDGNGDGREDDMKNRQRHNRNRDRVWKTTEEKKELLGTMLGNVDALVEGVRKAGIWGLG